MEFYLRRATEQDFEFLFELHALTLGPYVKELWSWDETWQRNNYREHHELDEMHIIQVDGRDVGVLYVEDEPATMFIRLIEIHPDMQGKGLGSSVIKSVLEQGKNRGKPVRLRVLTNNPARKLYERLGFTLIESTETHHMMKCTME